MIEDRFSHHLDISRHHYPGGGHVGYPSILRAYLRPFEAAGAEPGVP